MLESIVIVLYYNINYSIVLILQLSVAIFRILFSKLAIQIGAHQDPLCFDGKNRMCDFEGTFKITSYQSLLPSII